MNLNLFTLGRYIKKLKEKQIAHLFCCFRSIIFYPSVPIKLDYLGKRVDMAHGPFRGILLGLTQLNSSELHLKRLSKRDGILGVEKLISYCLNQWKNDIMHNQFSKLLKGVGPVKAVSQLSKCFVVLVFWVFTSCVYSSRYNRFVLDAISTVSEGWTDN